MKDFFRRYDSIKTTGLTDNSLHDILERFPGSKRKKKRSRQAESVNTRENSGALSCPTQSSSVAFGVPDKGAALLLCYYEDQ